MVDDVNSSSDLASEIGDRNTDAPTTFQIGDGQLVLRSSDRPLVAQFLRIYGDCVVDDESAHGPRVDCRVAVSGDWAELTVRPPQSVDLVAFVESAFADRGCRRVGHPAGGSQQMQCDSPALSFTIRGPVISFRVGSAWRHLAANLAIGCVLREQRDVLFMHASGIAFNPGRAGVVFAGPKAAGKTTTALGLAARGHLFFGDELVGIRVKTRELIPVRRAIAKRDGPCDSAVAVALAAVAVRRRPSADGQVRRMIRPGHAFGPTPAVAALRAVVLLEGFGDTAQLTSVAPSLASASRLTPVATSLRGQSAVARVFTLVNLLSAVACYSLRLGPPDETSALLETTFRQ